MGLGLGSEIHCSSAYCVKYVYMTPLLTPSKSPLRSRESPPWPQLPSRDSPAPAVAAGPTCSQPSSIAVEHSARQSDAYFETM